MALNMFIIEVRDVAIGSWSRSDGDDVGTRGQFTRASLKQAMAERFGAEARFHTCSASEMDAEALIDLLAARGKFIDSAEGFQTRADKICNHG